MRWFNPCPHFSGGLISRMFNRWLCLGLRAMLIAEDPIKMVLHLGNSLTGPTIQYTHSTNRVKIAGGVYAVIFCHLTLQGDKGWAFTGFQICRLTDLHFLCVFPTFLLKLGSRFEGKSQPDGCFPEAQAHFHSVCLWDTFWGTILILAKLDHSSSEGLNKVPLG